MEWQGAVGSEKSGAPSRWHPPQERQRDADRREGSVAGHRAAGAWRPGGLGVRRREDERRLSPRGDNRREGRLGMAGRGPSRS